jgi:hypothetical protein
MATVDQMIKFFWVAPNIFFLEDHNNLVTNCGN